MKITSLQRWIALLALCVTAAHAAPSAPSAPAAKPAVSDTQAAQDVRAARRAFAEKQKELADAKNVRAESSAPAPAAPLDLPIDETDSPGAVAK